MKRNQDQRVEDLSGLVGGRFSLTALVIKRMREYYSGGRTFMPKIQNQSEFFDLILDEIENQEITLVFPDEKVNALEAENDTESV